MSQYSNGEDKAEEAFLDAGFTPKAAGLLATANRWLFPFTVVVCLAALVWIGMHLWPDLDTASWQQWVDRNAAFFSPLDEGSTIGVLPELHSHMGLLIRKGARGLTVERRFWFPFDEVPVGLVVAPEAAERWLALDYGDERFWDDWQAIAEDGGIHVYQHLRRGSAGAAGYRAFVARLHSAGVE
jgi:hypothetical protein